MEDFGYRRNEEKSQLGTPTRKFFLLCAAMFSIACFIYITISAYYYVYQDKDGNVETIKSPEGPIKIIEEEVETAANGSMKIDRSIYEDIFGSKKEKLNQANPTVQTAVAPALPPKTLVQNNRQLVKENFPNAKLPGDAKPAQAAPTAAAATVQNPVVFSAQDKKAAATKDLLTKSESGATATKPSAVGTNKKRQIRVQVAAMTSKDAAQDAWKKINHLHTDLFSGLKPVIEEVDLGKRGIFYRLQIGNFFNQIEAEEFCSKYVAKTKKNKSDCIIVE
jgi:hypothetical protein